MENYALNPVKKEKNIKDLLVFSKDAYGDREVFRFKEGGGVKNISHEQFMKDFNAVGNALLGLSLGGKHIAVLGETSYEWLVSYFAVICGVGVGVPVDKELPDDEILNVLLSSGSAAVVFSDAYAQSIENIRGRLPKETILIQMKEKPIGDGVLSLWDIAAGAKDNGFEQAQIDENAMCSLLYTSGTTGKSKGVMLTHKNFTAAAAGALNMLDLGKVCMSILPVHHSYEFSHGILMMIQNGTTICINDSLRHFLPNLKLFAPDTLCVVPLFAAMMYRKIFESVRAAGNEEAFLGLIQKSNELLEQGVDKRAEFFGSVKEAFGGKLEVLLCGGAPLSADIMRGFRDLGIVLVNGYGITECSPLVAVNRNRFLKDGSVGVPIGCCVVEIREKDENGEGEIWVKGENVMLGYYQNPQATAEVMEDGWFNTGDIGYIDDDGFLFLTGRKKNLIVLNNGKNIYPEEIEEYLMRIPYIKETIVYAPMADGTTETVLNALIYVDETFSAEHTEKEIMECLRADIDTMNKTLPFYKQVRQFKLRDCEFEKTTKKSIKRFTVG